LSYGSVKLLELAAFGFQKLENVQSFQRRDAGDVDFFQLVADLVIDLQFHIFEEKESYISYALETAYKGMVNILL
jgi:hypothetical protein